MCVCACMRVVDADSCDMVHGVWLGGADNGSGGQKPGLDAAGALPDLHGFIVGVFMLVRIGGVVGELETRRAQWKWLLSRVEEVLWARARGPSLF